MHTYKPWAHAQKYETLNSYIQEKQSWFVLSLVVWALASLVVLASPLSTTVRAFWLVPMFIALVGNFFRVHLSFQFGRAKKIRKLIKHYRALEHMHKIVPDIKHLKSTEADVLEEIKEEYTIWTRRDIEEELKKIRKKV
jgi:uncharacterized membrane protein